MRDTRDKHINQLILMFAVLSKELIPLLSSLILASPKQRTIATQRILHLLQTHKVQVTTWSHKHILNAYLTSDQTAKALLSISRGPTITSWTYLNQQAVDELIADMIRYVHKALDSVTTLIYRFTQKTQLHLYLGHKLQKAIQTGLEVDPKIIQQLQRVLSTGMISITGANGKTYHYSLDYYVGMVAHQTKLQALTKATLVRAQQNGHDLIRISPNDSTIGDYCDAYKGKVFSISGTSDMYPALGDTPNGGTPFHVWCKHTSSIFIPELHTKKEQRAFSQVDKQFLLQGNQDNVNRIAKDWWKSKKQELVN